MFGLNHWELLIFFAIVLLLFGKTLPGAMRSLGLSFTEFKKGVQGIDEDGGKTDKEEQDSPKPDQPASTPSA